MPKKKATKVKKAKTGKGKKDGKQESKVDKESDIEKAKASAALWEARLEVTELSRTNYREAARRLARANEELTSHQYLAEKDLLDIIGEVKLTDAEKDEKIVSLEQQLKRQKTLAREEQYKLSAEYMLQIKEQEERYKKLTSEFQIVRAELNTLEEFRRRKPLMEQELRNIKESMLIADRNHKEHLAKMEHRFFCEKERLEKEAEQRIAQLAEWAHNDAIVQLDEASQTVFKENVRLNEALNYHIKEAEDLRKLTTSLAQERTFMALNKETDDMVIKKNVTRVKAQREQISELKAKVASLEEALELTSGESEQDRKKTQEQARSVSHAGQVEVQRLQRVLATREKELARLKQLSGSIVQQRTELERFFHEALLQVKKEVQASRVQYREEALHAYRGRMSQAMAGRQEYPSIRTFDRKTQSTNCVYADLEEAEKWTHVEGNNVDMADLTWEQKEKVLRLLFAKMNGQKARKPSQPLALTVSSEKDPIDSYAAGITEQTSLVTFITQAPVSSRPSNPTVLPNIHTA